MKPPETVEPPVAIEVRILGSLQVLVDGMEVEVSGRKRRAVLALLVMASPEAMSTGSLVDAVWPTEQPAVALGALQSHISRLRRILGRGAARLEHTEAGYRLWLAPEELDATRATRLVHAGRRAAATDPVAALRTIRDARRLWRGPALGEFDDVESLTAWRWSLDELWLTASDALVELALALGEIPEAVEVATASVAANRLREASVLLLMRALARAGRTAEALRAGRTYRRDLADETGLQPTMSLNALEHSIASSPSEVDDTPTPASPALGVSRVALIGRDAELAGLARLLRTESLTTIVGPGGVGKTLLALEAARRDASGREVTVLRLEAVTDGGALADVLATGIGLRGAIGDSLLASVGLLGSRPWLLVVDNCEHVLDAARDLLDTLMQACPRLTLLATSRERLALPMETTFRLDPLPLPDAHQRIGTEDVASVALFVERARRVRPDLSLDGEQLGVIAGIVRRLDGMPLAIELAANRLSSLSLRDLGARLDRAVDLLGDGTASSLSRHRTLRATIDWSYRLLPEHEQDLFRRLSLFADGFDLLTAEEIAADGGAAHDPTVAVAHLVDASMLVARLGDAPRYRMLDTLRSFGLDQLAARHERDAATKRFLGWAERLARWVDTAISTEQEPAASRRLLAELGNLRAAWSLGQATGALDVAITLVVSLHFAAMWRGLTEVWNWAVELAADHRVLDHPDAGAVFGAASRATWHGGGSLQDAEALARRGLELAGTDARMARQHCLSSLADVLLFQGRYPEARAAALEAGRGAPWEAYTMSHAALSTAYAGDLDEARTLNAHAPARASSPTALGFHHYATAEIDNLAHSWDSAEHHYREAVRLADTGGATFLHGVAAVGLAAVLAANGRFHDALLGYRDLIDRWERTGSWTQQWTTLRNVADVFDRLGERETATVLRCAADEAPESSALTDTRTGGRPPRIEQPRHVSADSHAARADALHVARTALARWLSATG